MAEKGKIVARGRYPRSIVSTGMWIRDHLLEVGEDYPFHMWKLLRERKGGRGGTYQNFRNYIHWLVKLNLIRFTREEPSLNPMFKPRRYYACVPENIDRWELWRNPSRALYPKTWEKHHHKKRV